MASKVTTHLTLIVENEVADADREKFLEKHDADSLEEVANEMEESVAALVANRVFGDADDIPVLDVSTEVREDV